MRLWGAIAAGAVALFGLALGLFLWLRVAEHPAPNQASPAVMRPTLYCEFYNFMHSATVVGFDFAVERDTEAKPAFAQLYVVEADGTRTDFADTPRWTYAIDDGTPSITSPDTATQIVLYGLKPDAPGVFWTEAGIRSSTYRNLEGKCRQAHLDKAARIDAKPPGSIAR